MPWIGDVASGQQVISGWGNNIRDHIVQMFVNKAEMTTQSVPKEGMYAHCSDTHITYVRVGGQWWVVDMPWKAYNGQLYTQPTGGGGITSVFATGSILWRQSMGAAQAIGSLVGTINQTLVGYYVYIGTPVTMQTVQQAGFARIYNPGDGKVYGAAATWADNGGPSGASRCIIQNIGSPTGSPLNASIIMPTGYIQFNVDANLSFVCDPSVDQALG